MAKVVSTSLAINANWIGNRWWTFMHRRRADVLREAVEFALVSITGSAIALVCLGISHYGFRLVSPLADNISANVIGLALGSLVRFTLYQKYVFPLERV